MDSAGLYSTYVPTADPNNRTGAWAGLFYLSLYLAAKLHVLDNRGEVWKTFIVLIPTLGAALIAISRIMDARHHPFDVISGSMLGALVAWCSYRQYFGPISETWRKGRAYPIRSWATQPAAPDSAAVDREVLRNDGVEPLRASDRSEEEQYPPIASTAVPDASSAPHDNVFRAQVSKSQRRRQADAAPSPFPPAAYTSVTESRNPFPVRSRSIAQPPQQQHRRSDGYWTSSSEEDNDEEYELSQQYTLNDPEGQAGQRNLEYNTRQDAFGRDTAYRPASYAQPALELRGVGPSPETVAASTIPPVRSPPPQHVGPVSVSQPANPSPTRGVNLVETYAK